MSSDAWQGRQAPADGPPDLPVRNFVASRLQNLMPSIMAVSMLSIAMAQIVGGNPGSGWWFALLGVPLAGVVLISLTRPYRLELSVAGFRYVSVFGRARSYPWTVCGPFRVARWPDGYRKVSPQG